MHLDRVHGDEQRLRDLLVGEALRDELRDAPLGGGQVLLAAPAEAGDVLARALRPLLGAGLLEQRERGVERLARRLASACGGGRSGPGRAAPARARTARRCACGARARARSPRAPRGGRRRAASSSARQRALSASAQRRSLSLRVPLEARRAGVSACSSSPRAISASIAGTSRIANASPPPRASSASAYGASAVHAAAASPRESSSTPSAAATHSIGSGASKRRADRGRDLGVGAGRLGVAAVGVDRGALRQRPGAVELAAGERGVGLGLVGERLGGCRGPRSRPRAPSAT